jgi:AraC-like DNA-binding protein
LSELDLASPHAERHRDASDWIAALRAELPGVEAIAAKPGFAADIQLRMIAGRAMRLVQASAQELQHRGHPGYEPVALLVQRAGVARITQRGASVLLAPGSAVFLDTGAPTVMAADEEHAQLMIELPAASLNAAPLLSGPLRALTPESPIDAPLLSAIAGLWRAAPLLDPTQQHHASLALDALASITSAAVAGRQAASLHVRFERAVAYIAAHLADPDLDAAQVAAAQHISRRSLDAIFAERGWTITRWIWEQRLDAASRALRAPGAARLSIFDIALAHGFSSPGHFSRAFRARYSATPSAWRAGVK